MFATTSLPVGGAETLLANLVRTLDRRRFTPEIICLKSPGPLGEKLSREILVHRNLIHHKFDLWVIERLRKLFRDRHADALITVGAGDKMFWGRLAARIAGVPVILSALHSTGWPDGVGRLNRMLTPITDGFIAVASSHRRFLIEQEHFPASKVFLIPNGIDTQRFVFDSSARRRIRAECGVSESERVVGIVAALRPEKNHEWFLQAAREVIRHRRNTRFWIVGDGPQRTMLAGLAEKLGIKNHVSFLGSRSDIPSLLSAIDVFALTSHNEASPVSILEAMACERPVVAPRVGSIGDTIFHNLNGMLLDQPSVAGYAQAWLSLLSDDDLAHAIGQAGRDHVVQHGSLDGMTRGYEEVVSRLYRAKTARRILPSTPRLLTQRHAYRRS
jgi:glycosyltransferase involved in cell wall biosynthesis